jgi:hypothetical protein
MAILVPGLNIYIYIHVCVWTVSELVTYTFWYVCMLEQFLDWRRTPFDRVFINCSKIIRVNKGAWWVCRREMMPVMPKSDSCRAILIKTTSTKKRKESVCWGMDLFIGKKSYWAWTILIWIQVELLL